MLIRFDNYLPKITTYINIVELYCIYKIITIKDLVLILFSFSINRLYETIQNN